MAVESRQQKSGSAQGIGITRRDAVHRVIALMGGLALVGEERLLAFSIDSATLARVTAEGVGEFTESDVALLDEVAETILPETSTPGAKAAKTGAFMALMVTDAYTDRDQQVFRDGMRALEEACRAETGAGFMQATPGQRLTLLEALDREQKTAMEERSNPARTRYPGALAAEDVPAHYFRMMKELALLGYFTSEIGYTQAMRYRESPGRFDPDVPHAPGDKSWAPHA
jgi:glucoside 3-dehydrogenase (cytochrome c) hitch-hiker subunit